MKISFLLLFRLLIVFQFNVFYVPMTYLDRLCVFYFYIVRDVHCLIGILGHCTCRTTIAIVSCD